MVSSVCYHSPIGWMEIRASEKGICGVRFTSGRGHSSGKSAVLEKCTDQLKAYFNHERHGFRIRLDLEGTDFQIRVWKELRKISFGKTITYAALAARLGDEKLVRAIGHAVGQNPVPILIPCHRVIGSDLKLVGYSGGLEKKKWLLEHECAFPQMDLFYH